MSRIIAAALAAVCLFSLTSSPEVAHAGGATTSFTRGDRCC